MSRTKFGSDSGHLTKWLPVGELDIDATVQRPLNKAWAEKIGRELDPDMIGVFHVSRRSNGKHVVIDGQHRHWGIKNVFGNNGTLVECKVYEGLSKQQEAALFVGLNNFRRPTTAEVFLKNVVAGEATATAINKIVRECGFKVDRAKADGTVTAVASLTDVYFGFLHRDPKTTPEELAKMTKPQLLRDTLSVVGEAWGGAADSLAGAVISGVGRLLAARQRAMDISDLAHKLATYPGGAPSLVGAARGRMAVTGGTIGLNVAEICLDLYNKGRRTGNKLESLR